MTSCCAVKLKSVYGHTLLPRDDLNTLLPRDDLNTLLPRDDLNRLLPRDDLNTLLPRDDLNMFANPAADPFSGCSFV